MLISLNELKKWFGYLSVPPADATEEQRKLHLKRDLRAGAKNLTCILVALNQSTNTEFLQCMLIQMRDNAETFITNMQDGLNDIYCMDPELYVLLLINVIEILDAWLPLEHQQIHSTKAMDYVYSSGLLTGGEG